MSVQSDIVGAALQNIRVSLEEQQAGENIHRNLGKKTGFLDFAYTDPAGNRIQTAMQNESGKGKYRPVDIYYYEREIEYDSIETDDTAFDCTTVDDKEKKLTTEQPQQFVAKKITISEDELRETLEDPAGLEEFREQRLEETMRVMREHMNRTLFSIAGNNAGFNPRQNNSGFTTLNLLNANYELDKGNFDDMHLDFQDGAYINTPFSVVGLGEFRKYVNRIGIAAVNDGGLDFAEIASQYGFTYFRDNDTSSALSGDDRVLALAPGFVKPFYYNMNQGFHEFQITDQDFKGTMMDPVYPIRWDYDVIYDRACDTGNGIQGAWTIRLYLYYDLFILPTDAFSTYDELNGFNGIMGYNITQS